MKFTFGKSIGTRLIATLLLVLIVGQGVGAALFLYSIRSGFMDALHVRMKQQVKQAAGVLGEPAVTYNTSLIESYLAETMKDQDIQAIRVLDNEGKPIREQVASRRKSDPLTLNEPLSFGGNTIGSVRLEYAAKTIDDSMAGSLLIIPLYQGLMLIVVTFVIIRIFNSHVKRPVAELNRAIDKITSGELAVEIPVARNDEVGSIANGVKYLVERLAGTIARINSISFKVSEAVQQVTDTFDGVRGGIDRQNRTTAEVSHAVNNANDALLQIVGNTKQLLDLSGDNLSTLLQMHASSEEIAGTTDGLTRNIQDSYSTLSELARSAREMAQMSEQVTVFVGEASTSIEQVYRSVNNAEQLINESARLSTQTTTVISDKGMAAVATALEGMKRIGLFVDSLMTAIERLGSRSRDIDKILGVIEDVTAKSRLLSLNAQILAAQAGIHGQGFAVVAEEMKQLSDRAALSTGEIAGIVSAIQKEIGDVVNETRDSVSVVREGESVVDRTASVLEEILATSRKATELAKGIERASQEQTSGLRLVVNATEQIRDKIAEVHRGTSEQEKSTDFLLKALHPIREGMEATRRATGEQANSSKFISGNIELANQKNSDIARESANQQHLNQRVLEALRGVVEMGHVTVAEVDRLVPQVTDMREEMEALRLEMAGFRTE